MRTLVSCRYLHYSTNDTLDAGEALWLAHFFPNLDYAQKLKKEASIAVERLYKQGEFDGGPQYRLGFREFGTTIGVQMHEDLWPRWEPRVEQLHGFWRGYVNARDNDITPVMYCTSLIPGVFKESYI